MPASPPSPNGSAATGPLLTVGHGTQPAEDFDRLLAEAGVTSLVDIRAWPASRRHPQFQRFSLEQRLPGAGIEYRWERRLGGYRPVPPDSPDTALRNTSFRGYAAHLRSAECRAALAELLEGARGRRTVVMCSESVWWRCHRRMVADALVLLRHCDVRHLMPDGRLAEHRPTDGVRVVGDELFYDVVPGPDALFSPSPDAH